MNTMPTRIVRMRTDPDDWYDDDDHDPDNYLCPTCGGMGLVEYADHPELWGEDCPSLENHLLPCPDCHGE